MEACGGDLKKQIEHADSIAFAKSQVLAKQLQGNDEDKLAMAKVTVLHNVHLPEEPPSGIDGIALHLSGVFWSNAYPTPNIDNPDMDDMALLPTISRFNHSCAPNAVYGTSSVADGVGSGAAGTAGAADVKVNDEDKAEVEETGEGQGEAASAGKVKSKSAKKREKAAANKAAAATQNQTQSEPPKQATHMEVVAVRDIKAGEEICVSYMPSDVLEAPKMEERVEWARVTFGFLCQCGRCTGKKSQATGTDLRGIAMQYKSSSRQTLQIASYKNAIQLAVQQRVDTAGGYAKCKELVLELYAKEYEGALGVPAFLRVLGFEGYYLSVMENRALLERSVWARLRYEGAMLDQGTSGSEGYGAAEMAFLKSLIAEPAKDLTMLALHDAQFRKLKQMRKVGSGSGAN